MRKLIKAILFIWVGLSGVIPVQVFCAPLPPDYYLLGFQELSTGYKFTASSQPYASLGYGRGISISSTSLGTPTVVMEGVSKKVLKNVGPGEIPDSSGDRLRVTFSGFTSHEVSLDVGLDFYDNFFVRAELNAYHNKTLIDSDSVIFTGTSTVQRNLEVASAAGDMTAVEVVYIYTKTGTYAVASELIDDLLVRVYTPPPDADNDGIPDHEDNCPYVSNQNQADQDKDQVGDVCDNCPGSANTSQTNSDQDTLGDVCDNCPFAANENQANYDQDAEGDACDSDDDNDGFSDAAETQAGSNPLNPASVPEVCDGKDNDLDQQVDEGFLDTDNDGKADCVDKDDDGDGLSDMWEQLYNLDPLDDGSVNPDNGAQGDPDQDTYTNIQELNAQTDPRDPDSNPNQAPIGLMTLPANDIKVFTGETVYFQGSGSDPDNHLPLSFYWNFGIGSNVPSVTVEAPGNVVFQKPGIYTVTFRVTDALGKADPTPAKRLVEVTEPAVPTAQAQGAAQELLRQVSQIPPVIRYVKGIPRFAAVQVPIPSHLPDDAVVAALDFVSRFRDFYLLVNPLNQFYLHRIKTDRAGGKHVFFGQRKGNIPVFGSSLGIHMEGGSIASTQGNYLKQIPWFPDPRITPEKATAIVLNHAPGQNLASQGEIRLMYFNPALLGGQNEDTHLAWRVMIRGTRTLDRSCTLWTYLVDAHDGTILYDIDESREGDYPGEDFDIETVDNSSSDVCWTIWDWWHRDNWFTDDGPTGDYPGTGSAGDPASWPDPYNDGQDAFNAAHNTYHYFYDMFGRRSWGGRGEMDVKVHVNTNWINAQYRGGCDFVVFGDSVVTPDVVAHEFTHGLVAYTSDLVYQDQSGALEESYCDVFGSLVADSGWLIGSGIWTQTEDAFHGGGAGAVGDAEGGDNCQNNTDDDGDGVVNDGCREEGGECDNSIDDDGDGFVNEGCPEAGADCGNLLDDDGDGAADEGCPGSCFDGISNAPGGAADIADNDCYFRNMEDPTTAGDPDHMDDFWITDRDRGGVHSNSGIPNKVFQLLVDGGSHYGVDVGLIAPGPPGRTKSAHLYYDVVTSRLTGNSQMIDARDATVEQARAYLRDGSYFFNTWDVCNVINAFHSVGLGDPDTDCDGYDDMVDTDDDGDGVGDGRDNCPLVHNPAQWDYDDDGIGNACDLDTDGDGVCNTGGPLPTGTQGAPSGCDAGPSGEDNCEIIYNPDQADADGDGRGNACDDYDLDGVMDVEDNCPGVNNHRTSWTDMYGSYHYDQPDFDLDGIGDACDWDDDGDGIGDSNYICRQEGDNNCLDPDTCIDNCPCSANSSQTDQDSDGFGDACDNCIDEPNPEQQDIDDDGSGDACDGDMDGDGVPNDEDNCPFIPNPSQAEWEGQGMACHPNTEFIVLAQGPSVLEFLFRFGSAAEALEIPLIFDPCYADGCPDYVAENYVAQLAASAPAGMPMRIVDDRGYQVAATDFGENRTLRFNLKADHFYRLPDMGGFPALHIAMNDAVEDDYFRGTHYYLQVAPPENAQPGEEFMVGIQFMADTDGDGTTDDSDNCRGIENPDQADSDSDGMGDACDPCAWDMDDDTDVDGKDLSELMMLQPEWTRMIGFAAEFGKGICQGEVR